MVDAVFKLAEQVNFLRGQIEGYVRHETQAAKINELRRELIDKIEGVLKQCAELIDTAKISIVEGREASIRALEAEMEALESRAKSYAKSEVGVQLEAKLADQDKNIRRARTAMYTGGGVGVAVPLVALFQHFFGGGS